MSIFLFHSHYQPKRSQKLAKTYQRPDILDLQPDTNVAIELINIDDSQWVKSILSEKIKAKGWILAPNAEVKIAATLGSNEETKVLIDPYSGDKNFAHMKLPNRIASNTAR